MEQTPKSAINTAGRCQLAKLQNFVCCNFMWFSPNQLGLKQSYVICKNQEKLHVLINCKSAILDMTIPSFVDDSRENCT
jgi:hypothetical protein